MVEGGFGESPSEGAKRGLNPSVGVDGMFPGGVSQRRRGRRAPRPSRDPHRAQRGRCGSRRQPAVSIARSAADARDEPPSLQSLPLEATRSAAYHAVRGGTTTRGGCQSRCSGRRVASEAGSTGLLCRWDRRAGGPDGRAHDRDRRRPNCGRRVCISRARSHRLLAGCVDLRTAGVWMLVLSGDDRLRLGRRRRHGNPNVSRWLTSRASKPEGTEPQAPRCSSCAPKTATSVEASARWSDAPLGDAARRDDRERQGAGRVPGAARGGDERCTRAGSHGQS